MHKEILLGNEAVALGLLEGGCNVISAYPGTPSSEVLPYANHLNKKFNLQRFVEWSVNEKSAFELAYANAIAGGNSAVIMKQVGLNVAMDPLMSAAYIGLKGAMVVVVADDPGPYSSQTEQDTRFAAMFAKLPVLDPSTPQEGREFAKKALKISNKYEIPVILRLTNRVSHGKQDIEYEEIPKINLDIKFEKNPQRWAAIPRFRYLQHIELNNKIKKLANENEYSLKKYNDKNKNLIITSGCCYSHIIDSLKYLNCEKVDVLKLDMPYPLNIEVSDIINNYENILIIEETMPVIEYQILKYRNNVDGRLTGIIPGEGELSIDKIVKIVSEYFKIKLVQFPEFNAKSKKPELCPGCPHRSSFYSIIKAFPKGIYPSDIGCYTLGLNMNAVDTCLCMGATINQASGFYHAFKSQNKEIPPIVATIGDSTFYHSGVTALINSVYNKSAFVLVVLDNGTTAMTGFQPTPESGILNSGHGNKVPLKEVIKGCGIEKIHVLNPNNINEMIECLKECWDYSVKNEKISVIIAKEPCTLLKLREKDYKFIKIKINEDKCTGCRVCSDKFQCPSLIYDEKRKKVFVDYSTCNGCGVCVQVCKFEAIEIE